MHAGAFHYVEKVLLQQEQRPRTVVELGSRNVNGTVRGLFGPRAVYTGVDIWPGAGVDIVADASDWKPPEPVDCVVCCEVLEHVWNGAQIVKNAIEMLKPGGLLILTAAMAPRKPHSGMHGGPLEAGEWYDNVDPLTLMEWLKGGCTTWEVETDDAHGDVRAWGVK